MLENGCLGQRVAYYHKAFSPSRQVKIPVHTGPILGRLCMYNGLCYCCGLGFGVRYVSGHQDIFTISIVNFLLGFPTISLFP